MDGVLTRWQDDDDDDNREEEDEEHVGSADGSADDFEPEPKRVSFGDLAGDFPWC